MTPKVQSPCGQFAPTPPTQYWPLVIISDIHFGKKISSADMLFEFLQRTRCDTLILNGDIIDGWHLTGRRQHKFPEMQKRVMDLINARIAEGMKVIYIPGNHDEALRKRGIFGKNYFGIHFSDSLIYTDRRNRRFFILHGDQFDPQILKDKGRVLFRIGDYAYEKYERLTELNSIPSKASRKLLKQKFSISAYANEKAKNVLTVVGKFEKAVTQSAKKEGVDGIICGHVHLAEFEKKGNIHYGNSGDWVESCTALTCDEQGDWRVVRWLDERERLGLSDYPDEHDSNPYQAYRSQTERQLRLMQRIWPANNRSEILENIRALGRDVEHTNEKLRVSRHQLKL